MVINRSGWLSRLITGATITGLLLLGTVRPASAGTIIYVNRAAGGANNGTSWADAYKSLQSALGASVAGDQIWVAAGTYKPTPTTDRTKSFRLKSAVAVYGGFAGTETALSQRSPKKHITILSGDIGAFGVQDDSYHVVITSGTDSSTILDGFSITAGNADGSTYPDTQTGAGIFNSGGSPVLQNLVVQGNYSHYGAGMINLKKASPKLSHVTFSGNQALQWGGAIYNDTSTITLTSAAFNANVSFSEGGAIYDYKSNLKMAHVVFSGNQASFDGGALVTYQGSAKMTNVTFSGNTAAYAGAVFFSYDSPALTNVNFIDNSATGNSTTALGGAVENYGSNGTFRNATFSGNSSAAGRGGALANEGQSPKLINATFYSNTAGTYGGAIYNNASTPALTNVTVSGNSAGTSGRGMYQDASSHPVVNDSVFWGDGTEIVNGSGTVDVLDSIVAGGDPAGCSTCTNVGTGDPALGPLQKNGGFTKTMALTWDSNAIDAGNNSTCAKKDQRGIKRPQGDACDLGAYEVKVRVFYSQAAYDGQVLESATGSNIGGSNNSTNSTLRVGDDGADRRYRGILSFDTSTLPNAATPVFAELRVRQSGAAVGAPFSTQGSFIADEVDPYFGSSASLKNSDFQVSGSINPEGTFNPDGASYWMALEPFGLNAIDTSSTTQFRLRFSHGDSNSAPDYITLFSGEASTPSYRPRLIVYYNP